MGGRTSEESKRLGNVRSLEAKAREALQGGKRNVFISFATEDMAEVNLLRGQAKNENGDIEFNDHSVRVPYDSVRAEYIRSRITERINRSSITVVYITNAANKSPWVKWEVAKSIELGKKVIATHAGTKLEGGKPSWIADHGIKVVPWSGLAKELK